MAIQDVSWRRTRSSPDESQGTKRPIPEEDNNIPKAKRSRHTENNPSLQHATCQPTFPPRSTSPDKTCLLINGTEKERPHTRQGSSHARAGFHDVLNMRSPHPPDSPYETKGIQEFDLSSHNDDNTAVSDSQGQAYHCSAGPSMQVPFRNSAYIDDGGQPLSDQSPQSRTFNEGEQSATPIPEPRQELSHSLRARTPDCGSHDNPTCSAPSSMPATMRAVSAHALPCLKRKHSAEDVTVQPLSPKRVASKRAMQVRKRTTAQTPELHAPETHAEPSNGWHQQTPLAHGTVGASSEPSALAVGAPEGVQLRPEPSPLPSKPESGPRQVKLMRTHVWQRPGLSPLSQITTSVGGVPAIDHKAHLTLLARVESEGEAGQRQESSKLSSTQSAETVPSTTIDTATIRVKPLARGLKLSRPIRRRLLQVNFMKQNVKPNGCPVEGAIATIGCENYLMKRMESIVQRNKGYPKPVFQPREPRSRVGNGTPARSTRPSARGCLTRVDFRDKFAPKGKYAYSREEETTSDSQRVFQVTVMEGDHKEEIVPSKEAANLWFKEKSKIVGELCF